MCLMFQLASDSANVAFYANDDKDAVGKAAVKKLLHMASGP